MKFSFRLAELLNHLPDPKRRPGTIKNICDYTGLDRHQVSALLKNEAKYVPLHALSQLCDYLIKHGYADADSLPGALFAVEPEHFWELLARRRRLELCLGVRVWEEWPEGAWVVASDSLLLGRLLSGVSTLGGTATFRKVEQEVDTFPLDDTPPPEPPLVEVPPPHPEDLKQSLVWAPGQRPDEEVQARARDVYRAFDELKGDKGIVGLGSTKSNPIVELMVASTFGCEPFQAQEVEHPHQRACPFFLSYRPDRQPHPRSCHGGLQLARSQPGGSPGIYYEGPDGTWNCAPWDEEKHEPAMVFYTYRESQGRLEMVLGGFSGRGTRLLSQTLATRSEEFWPPTYDNHGVQIGAWVIEYAIKRRSGTEDILSNPPVATTKIVRIEREVIARRMNS